MRNRLRLPCLFLYVGDFICLLTSVCERRVAHLINPKGGLDSSELTCSCGTLYVPKQLSFLPTHIEVRITLTYFRLVYRHRSTCTVLGRIGSALPSCQVLYRGCCRCLFFLPQLTSMNSKFCSSPPMRQVPVIMTQGVANAPHTSRVHTRASRSVSFDFSLAESSNENMLRVNNPCCYL